MRKVIPINIQQILQSHTLWWDLAKYKCPDCSEMPFYLHQFSNAVGRHWH